MTEEPSWRTTLPAQKSALLQVKSDLRQFLETLSVPNELILDALLVSEELLVNAIQHSGVPADGAPIEICCRQNSGTITLEITDTGKEFNPLSSIESPDLDADDEERIEGGFGFFIVEQIAQSIEYNRRGNKNHLKVLLPSINPTT
ncbi:MAG: ATP-binding protein [Verrucomicrobiota bacterium]